MPKLVRPQLAYDYDTSNISNKIFLIRFPAQFWRHYWVCLKEQITKIHVLTLKNYSSFAFLPLYFISQFKKNNFHFGHPILHVHLPSALNLLLTALSNIKKWRFQNYSSQLYALEVGLTTYVYQRHAWRINGPNLPKHLLRMALVEIERNKRLRYCCVITLWFIRVEMIDHPFESSIWIPFSAAFV